MDDNSSYKVDYFPAASKDIKDIHADSDDQVEVTDVESDSFSFLDKKNNFKILDEERSLVECKICFKELKKNSLSSHMKSHYGLKPFNCETCVSSFSRKTNLLRHCEYKHNPKRDSSCKCQKEAFPCSVCNQKFNKKNYYDSHVKYEQLSKEDEEILEDLSYKDTLNEDDYISANEEEMMGDINSVEIAEMEPPNEKNLVDEERDETFILKLDFENEKGKILENNDIVDKVVETAVNQAEDALSEILSSSGCNFTSRKRNQGSSDVSVKRLAKINPKSSEIHVTASIDGKLQKFVQQLPPGSNLDARTQTGMDIILNTINNMCSGKGEIDNPLEVSIHHNL